MIAVVGVTGIGKSRFIRRVTERKDVKVGAGLFSGNIPRKPAIYGAADTIC